MGSHHVAAFDIDKDVCAHALKLNICDITLCDIQTISFGDSLNRFTLDTIIMNPPFHQTRKAEPDIGKSFIIQASELLTPKGQLWMVANRQLAYETTLDKCFTSVNSITETPQFKVINALRPKKQIFR